MVDPELVNNIKARFQQGEKSSEVKEALLNEGWMDGDIEAAFGQIRHEAYMQIPLYAKVHNWMQSVDKKAAELPTRTVVQIFVAISLVFIGGVFLLYYFLDPLGIRSAERDKQREQASVELRLALEKYYKENGSVFPDKLDKLVPKYLPSVPVDPRSHKPYEYKTLAQNLHYEYCIDFEVQIVRCVSSDDSSSIPVVAPPQTAPQVVQYAINGQAYFDVDKDGEKNNLEGTPQGLAVKITDVEGGIHCETITDSSGIFNCNMSSIGQYLVTITTPPGYTSTLGNPIPVGLPAAESATPNVATLFIGLIK